MDEKTEQLIDTETTLTNVSRTIKTGAGIMVLIPRRFTQVLGIQPGMMVEIKIRNTGLTAPSPWNGRKNVNRNNTEPIVEA